VLEAVGDMNKTFLRVAAVLVVAAGASACSSVPDWVDPTTWTGDDNTTAQPFPADESANQGPTVAEASDNGQYPDLANTPDRPGAPSSAQDRQQVADSLAADRQRTSYSGDALRGGTEAAAAPPPPPGSSDAIQQVDTGDQSDSSGSSDSSASAPAPVTGAQTTSGDSGSIDTTGGDNSSAQPTQTANSAVPAAAPTSADTTAAAAPTQDVASSATVPVAYSGGGTPAVPAVSPNGSMAGAQGVQMADAPLGFRPSSAPALDPSVSQFVAAPIVARYQQTAANAGVATSSVPYQAVAMTTPRRGRHSRGSDAGMGGPDDMSGSVTANFASLNSPSAGGAYANTNGATAVVYFPNDVAAISASGREQVDAAVQAWRSQGGQGYVRVIGHSSSRTPNMALEKHLQVIFNRSQAYANVVGRALIKAGIPADKVLIEAVGDSQPVYYESMPQGETGNRRAEIFVQG
jgi:outer membrane protein OmpA-like peptidoglycan-associated protein